MGDLHSIACSSLHSSSLGWDFHHDLGVFNADISQFMESTPFFSHLEPDFSSGYLQDALFEFSSKRRRLLFCTDDEPKGLNDNLNCYNSECPNFYENYDYLSQIMTKSDSISGEPKCRSVSRNSEEGSLFEEMRTSEEALSSETFDTSSPSHKDSVNILSASDKETLPTTDPIFSPAGIISTEKRRKRSSVIATKVVYPFAVVKPGGVEGDVTLNDINERIMMPPTRPVRHPVGEFAGRPLVSPDGPGLSGKAVVALTRIQTQGRGTITIIRTRG